MDFVTGLLKIVCGHDAIFDKYG